jgi:hypothetical protein
MQRLGDEPSVAEVEAAGRAIVERGLPDGADLEGMLVLLYQARARERAATEEDNDDSET